MAVVQRATSQRLTELARGLARGEYLIADDRREWLASLLFMAEPLAACSNLGIVLVPVAPHLGGHWVNGIAPGVTVQCVPVAREDVDELVRRWSAMHAALHPDDEAQA